MRVRRGAKQISMDKPRLQVVDGSARLRRRLLTCLAVPIGAVVICCIVLGGWALALQPSDNVHAVKPGVLYRSAQLNGRELGEVLSKYDVRSAIDLRGKNHGEWWHENELRITAAHGAAHFDVGTSATSEPKIKTIARLLKIMKSAPRPILIHCHSGSDRTGLAAALFDRFLDRESSELAAKQLSFWYGHFPWFGSGMAAMDRTFWRLSTNETAATNVKLLVR